MTITGLSNDLTNFNGGSYTSSTGTWTGTAAQFDALTFKTGEDGVQHLSITATTTGAEAGSSTENYTLTVNPVQVRCLAVRFGDGRAGWRGDAGRHGGGGLCRRHAGHGDDHRAGWRSDQFQRRHYTASTGTWTGTAAQFNALTFKAGGPGTFALSISATTTGAEAGSSTESYTLTVNNIGPLVSGTMARRTGRRGHAGSDRCGARWRRHAGHGDDHRAVERSDELQRRHLYVEHRHLDRHGGAVRCADVQGRRRRHAEHEHHRDRKRRRRRQQHGELHADRQPGGEVRCLAVRRHRAPSSRVAW